jgi:hypothetical protein
MPRPLTTSRLTPSSRISSQFTMLLLLLVVTVTMILQAPQPVNAMSTMNKNQDKKRSLIPPSQLQLQLQKQKRISLSSAQPQPPLSPRRQQQQQQQLTPPFPNGLCGGTILDISPEETFGVENLSVLGDMMLLPRTIKIWLPPGYNNDSNENETFNNSRQQRHPVLYVHDGQNAMEDEDSWTGASWRLMGALTRLADHKLIGSSSSSKTKTTTTTTQSQDNNNDDNTNMLPIVVLIPSAEGDLLPGVRRRHLVRMHHTYIIHIS